MFFDLLCEDDRESAKWTHSCSPRRTGINTFDEYEAPLHLTPATFESNVASDWFSRFEGAGLDGVMAKPISGIYESEKRVMLKVKHERDCDCVVAGFRWHKNRVRAISAVGSLLLGLFDDAGSLQHVGVCASFTQKKRQELVEYLAPYRKDALVDHP